MPTSLKLEGNPAEDGNFASLYRFLNTIKSSKLLGERNPYAPPEYKQHRVYLNIPPISKYKHMNTGTSCFENKLNKIIIENTGFHNQSDAIKK